MTKNGQNRSTKSVILWTLIGIACAAAFAFCIYCFAVVIPAKKEADRLALEEQRKQQELEQTMAPTATTVPTSKPTATAAPTITEEPKATVAPTEVPDITEEPLPTNTPEPTATSTPIPTPTDVPHEHKWVAKEQPATCTTGGRTWQECECGEIQNEVILEALGHGKLIYTVVKEPTTEAEGKYEESCDICGTVVNKGNIKKLEPTPIPTATATPKPTNTPTPKPTSTPIPTPTEVPHKHKWVAKDFPATCTNDGKSWEECECGETKNEVVREATGHGGLVYTVVKEPTTKTEGKYEEVCEICGTVINKGSIKKLDPTPIPTATPTPTPKPTSTPTPKPTATPKPTNTPIPTPTTRPVVGTIQVNGETSITLTNMAPVEYTIFLTGTAASMELEYALSGDSILSVELMQGIMDRQYTVKMMPKGMNGKAGIVLTMYGTDEYGNRVLCDEVIIKVTSEIQKNYPFFTEDGLDYTGNTTLFPGSAVTMDTVNDAKYELAVLNIERAEEAPYSRTKDNKGHIIKATSSDETVVTVKTYNPKISTPQIILSPVSTGAATITVTLHVTELDGSNISNAVDTYTFTVTVEEFTSDVEFNKNDYVPADYGYPYLVGEWPYGDNITAQVWSSAEQPYGDCEAVLVFTGTGAMWNTSTAKKMIGKASPWNSYTTCRFNASINSAVIQEGITRTERIWGPYITSLSLPSSLKEIGEMSFSDMPITELVVPEGVEQIEGYAFTRTSKLVSVELPDTLTYIGEAAFSWDMIFGTETNQLKKIVIPNSVSYLGYAVFDGREGLEVVFENGTNTKGFHKDWDYGLK